MPDVALASNVVAVVPVRGGELPAGGVEVVAEAVDAGGRVVLIGDGCEAASSLLAGVCAEVDAIEMPSFAVNAWTRTLVDHLIDTAGAAPHERAPAAPSDQRVLLPASPDGRDLAPRLAAALDRPLFAGAMTIEDDTITTVRHGGRVLSEHAVHGAAVVTMQPGVRGVVASDGPAPQVHLLGPADESGQVSAGERAGVDDATGDAQVLEVLAPDVSTMDLSEAQRILGGGAGLDGAQRFRQLADVAAQLGAAMGATRVVTDRGWLEHSRQIGTTGVVVDPTLYLAFGISGAVQHTAGLGHPDHIVSINVDPYCPMMAESDLAVVADANQTLDELERLLRSGDDDETSDRIIDRTDDATSDSIIDRTDGGTSAAERVDHG